MFHILAVFFFKSYLVLNKPGSKQPKGCQIFLSIDNISLKEVTSEESKTRLHTRKNEGSTFTLF